MAGIGIAVQLEQIKADLTYIEKYYGNTENYTDTQLEQYERLITFLTMSELRKFVYVGICHFQGKQSPSLKQHI